MNKKEMEIVVLHAGIAHPSPYIHSFCTSLIDKGMFVKISPDFPSYSPGEMGIIHFNRLKRFYKDGDHTSGRKFIREIQILKDLGWQIS